MFNKEIFSRRLVSLRAERGIMAKDLAAAIGITKASMSQLESGLNAPSLNTLLALAEFFGVSIDFLVGKTDDLTPHNEKTSIENKDAPRREALLALWDSATPEQKDYIFRRLSGEKRLEGKGQDRD